MALNFGGGTGYYVNHGSAAVLDNLSTWTICFWVKPDASIGVNDKFFQKGTGAGGNGRRMAETSWHDADIVFTGITTASGDTEWESSDGWLSTGIWQFLAFTLDMGAGTQINGYRGTLAALASLDTPSYTAFTGSGVTSESAFDLYVGSDSSNNDSFYGDIALFAHWNSVLSLAQIRQQQFSLRPNVALSNLVCFSNYWGTGTQSDWSGGGSNGTVTSATASAHVPIAPVLGLDVAVPYSIAVPSVLSVSVSDSIGLAESVGELLPWLLTSQADAISLSDVVSLLQEFYISTADAIAVAEAVTLLLRYQVSVTDAIAIVETALLMLAHQVDAGDSINVAEVVTLLLRHQIDISDALAVADNLAVLVARPDLYISVDATNSAHLIRGVKIVG